MNPASADPKLTNPPAITDWLDVIPPPAPYLHVLRRSFRSGLHVLILVRENDGRLHVSSSVDHGTPRGSVRIEGTASDSAELTELLVNTCAKWITNSESDAETSAKPRKRYFHTQPGGGISGPVSREMLFQLLVQGAIPWHCQVWEELEGQSGSGRWRPIQTTLGFPTDGATDGD